MKRKILSLLAVLGLSTSLLVSAATPAEAAPRTISFRTYDSLDWPHTLYINTTDYGSYEVVNRAWVVWSGQGIRSWYTTGSDTGVRLYDGAGNLRWYTMSRWYYNTSKTIGVRCNEPCKLTARVHVEVSLAADRTLNIFGWTF